MTGLKWRYLSLAGAILVAGCDATASYQAVYTERIQAMQDQLAILKGIKDDETMEKALPKLRKISWRFEAIKKKAVALPALSEEAKTSLAAEFAAVEQRALRELVTEGARISKLPGGDVFLERMKKL